VAVRALVDPHDGRQRAAAEATNQLDSELEINGGATGGEVQFAQDLVQNPLAPADVAGRAQANLHVVPTPRLKAKAVVESSGVKYLGKGYLQTAGHRTQRALRQVVEPTLDIL
jgi:hypothetical protein